ncbi:copper homeostasis protein CutC [Fulvivirga sp.]|uniref:copper homeostasis protein CutC n=1 Tax=Fulvivirga sp. TaxID=1931237 RepID=UPI0032EFF963
MSYQLEICANSVQSVINAEKAGAQRVELCDNLWEGGTTPSAATIKLAKEKTKIAIYVLVRPRGGDFVYSDLEFEIIKEDIRICKELGVEGIVSGVLNADGTVDKARTKILVELSRPLPFTFHRAFDVAAEPFQALEDIIDCGAVRILTSGQKNSAIEGIELLKEIQEKAAGRIIIMPGGGINESNISKLQSIGCQEFHMSGKKAQKSMAKPGHVNMNSSKDIPENIIFTSDIGTIRSVIEKIDVDS